MIARLQKKQICFFFIVHHEVENFMRETCITPMTFTAQLSDEEILKDPSAALFRVSVEIAKHRHALESRCVGKTLAVEKYRGTVTAVDSKSISLKGEDGTQKSVPLNEKRVRQLLTLGDTTRK